ncbi:MAG: hypothetical protein JSS29_13725 [Proteobacteria bacterium]|nr:hypothetical protein [Pseudomonadota bacterium]
MRLTLVAREECPIMVGVRKTLTMAVVALLGALSLAAHPAACPTSAGMKDASQATKPSSFQPRPRPPNNAYGAPISGPILSRHVKTRKPAPKLRSTPLA